MNTPARLLLAALLLAVPAAAQAPRTEPRKSDPFDRTVDRINALLAHRLAPPAFEPARFNPFLTGPLAGSTPRLPDGGGTEPPPADSDDTVLRQLAPTLRITGSFSREDRNYVVIDGTPRREGDMIILRHRGATVNIRIRTIDGNRIVLGLNAAEFTLRF
jgi:hypothetical protein